MSFNTLVVIAVLLVAIWWLVRKRRAANEAKAAPRFQPRSKKTAYHAVSIAFQSDACDAARSMAGRRFLATAAPKLPLPDCDAEKCRCRFAHHDDRRSGRDRRSPFSPGQVGGTGRFEREKRVGTGRRAEDKRW